MIDRSTPRPNQSEDVVLARSDRPLEQHYECAQRHDGCPARRLLAELARAKSRIRQKEELVERYRHLSELLAWIEEAARLVACLTPRQHEIMDFVLLGARSKSIAAALRISQRTVEHHRLAIMKKTGSKDIPELARVGFAASLNEPGRRAFKG